MAGKLIVIDARTVRPGMTGVGRRTAHILRALLHGHSGFRFALITADRQSLEPWLGSGPPPPLLWEAPARERHLASEWWMATRLPRLLREHGAVLFDGPAFELPRRRLSVPCVVTIHDLAHRLRPATQPWRFRRWLEAATAHSVRTAARVVVPSASVRREIATVWPDAAAKIVEIPGGVDAAWRPATPEQRSDTRRREGIERGFLIHVGTFEPRKNHRFVLEVFTALQAECDDPPDLVLAGGAGPALTRVMRWIEQSPFRERIRVLTHLDDARLRALLAAADALVFPSLAEGYGLPVLEAAACGVPAVASAIPGHEQFAGQAAELLPLGDVRPWVDALLHLRRPEQRERRAAQAVSFASQYTWDRVAQRVLHLHREIAGG
ncbi:MAG: glycosyltransferase family 4 protein [Candidatus Sumerlaeia bacterium]|nr:glycosyltransferase family 4 protein [Candidatus Sumerlaeia bacterium]